MPAERTVLHWFRRDLRLTDNTALRSAVEQGAQKLVCVYVLSNWRSAHAWTGPRRQAFLCGSLAALARNLEDAGHRLILRVGDAVGEVLRLARETKAAAIVYNRDPDPFGRAVEARLEREAASQGIEARGFFDVANHDVNEVLTASGTPFRVFTPYARAWRKLDKRAPHGKAPLKRVAPVPVAIGSLELPDLGHWGLANKGPGDSAIEAGERAARSRLKRFLDGPICQYAATRNTPGELTTSRLSQDLRFGLLSPREIRHRCEELAASDGIGVTARRSIETFVSELIWREFYFSILAHVPEVLEHEFIPKFRRLQWTGSDAAFERWCAGETGFPFVDAGMRQLNATGFMHNRLRMVTAMFLTKDLHVDWRRGERHFMQTLVDGEIASNNGGWQWSAGTGADAAPYFRIQNPWTQGKRFDPEGEYIRTWVPELRDVPAGKLHVAPESGTVASRYPAPMVDHKTERIRCLELFSAVI